MNILNFFSDPVLRAPTIACMLMCLSASLVGVLIFVRKRSLLGETLSHATYPGITCSAALAGFLGQDELVPFYILIGAFFSALLGIGCIHLLQSRLKMSSDSTLCLVLAAFFGVGLTVASYVQFSHTHEYRQIQSYLYGQAATMTDLHIYIYGGLSLAVLSLIFLFYKELQIVSFDSQYARSFGSVAVWMEWLILFLVALAVVIGIRSVGIVLMSAMFIAPAVSSRQLTDCLSSMFFFSGIIGLLSGFLGNYFSVVFSHYSGWNAAFPTGPMIVLVASCIAIISLFFAPKKGLIIRYFRIIRFRSKKTKENLLKALWRLRNEEVTLSHISKIQQKSKFFLGYLLFYFLWKGWIRKTSRGRYTLTKKGEVYGGRVVRLHRLWEVYLVSYLGVGREKVHKSAEEMEHILTPELEKELTTLLDNPLQDPHHQPIPSREEVMPHG
jgi:manganese/zinc/iron transport system permease protein